jgi:hypothetical protein
VDAVSPGDPLPEIGVNKDFEQSLAGLQKGDVSQPVSVPPNRVALALVTNVIPSHPSTFEDAESRIRPVLEKQKLDELVTKRADELAAKAKSGGDLAGAAKALGLKVVNSEAFNRAASVEGLGQAVYVSQAFTTADGAVFGPVQIPDGRVVAKVVAHIPADASTLAAERSAIRDELKGKKGRERDQLFEAGLRERLIKEGKVKIHQDVLNRLIANYRG